MEHWKLIVGEHKTGLENYYKSQLTIFLHPCTCCVVPQIALITVYIPKRTEVIEW